MKIKLTELKELVAAALARQGYAPDEAKVIEEVLLYAQLRGNNQGVVKLIGPGIPKSPDASAVTTEKESTVSALLNAHQTHAMIAVNHAVDIAMNKAKEHGVGIVGVNGINTSSGALGFYAKRLADAGLVGIVCAGSMETVAAHGSSEAIFGTNPIAICVPSEHDPLVFDMTTSSMAYFGVVEAATAGKELPEGVAYDKAGNPTRKPKDVMDDGALVTFDGTQRGSGLSMMIQALTGPLMGAYFAGIGDMAKNWGGHFILAFDPNMFQGADSTRTGVSQMIEKVKGTRKLEGVEEILVPGERGNKRTADIIASGELEIEENLYNELKKAAGM